MRNQKLLLLVLVPLLLLGSIPLANNVTNTSNHIVQSSPTTGEKLSALESHYPLYIVGDTAFEVQAGLEFWPGDGSTDTPY